MWITHLEAGQGRQLSCPARGSTAISLFCRCESRRCGRNVTALNPYGVDIRYPADFPEMTLEDSKEALVLAAKVRDAVRSALKEFLEKGSS